MNNRKKTVRLSRRDGHRNALLSNQACSLIQHGRIRTTLGKAKAIRPIVEKMITLGKKDSVHARRVAFRFLRNKDAVARLFNVVAPAVGDRPGGYARITKLGARMTDSAQMAIIEWVDLENLVVDEEVVTADEAGEE